MQRVKMGRALALHTMLPMPAMTFPPCPYALGALPLFISVAPVHAICLLAPVRSPSPISTPIPSQPEGARAARFIPDDESQGDGDSYTGSDSEEEWSDND
ncbi:hypothetical protein EDB92DRAFT_1848137 [Lactarius akahatsu]|uniref:Uncharacterized protein n=1 Tax=Lactarius akahatsu TaxID=416441 RepID=A0AAD4QF99_9AGAM|nr:hypothetical protein EDB92DRAFT_1848137 [Lactarius akahatsu]